MSQALIVHLLGAAYHTHAQALRQALIQQGLTEVHVLAPMATPSKPVSMQLLMAHAEELGAAHQKGARVVISPFSARAEARYRRDHLEEADTIPVNFLRALDESWEPAQHLFVVLPPLDMMRAGQAVAPPHLPWAQILEQQQTAFVAWPSAATDAHLAALAEAVVAQAPSWMPSVTRAFTGVPKWGHSTDLAQLPEHLATAIRVLREAEPTPEHQRAAAVLASIQNMRQQADGSWQIEVPSQALYDFQAKA